MKYVDPIDVKCATQSGQLGVKLTKGFNNYDNVILYDILDNGEEGDAVCIGLVTPPAIPIGVLREYPNDVVCMHRKTYEEYKALANITLVRNL